jgi:type I restriction enzyme R subunit
VERVQYLDGNGKLITESLTDYTRKAICKNYASLDDFLACWNDAERKQIVIEQLASQGVFFEELATEIGREFDPFDLICHIAFNRPPLTRRERANKVKKRDIFGRYEAKARAVLEALLEKYADAGILSLESLEILKVDPFHKFGTPVEIVNLFGGKSGYLKALRELESELYAKAA